MANSIPYDAKSYTWRGPLGKYCLAHHDGSVSVMIQWSGIDTELISAEQQKTQWRQIFELLQRHGEDTHTAIELHWWRERDETLLQRYQQHHQALKRQDQFVKRIREEIADHYRPHARSNSVALVFTKRPTARRWSQLFRSAKQELVEQTELGKELLDVAIAETRLLNQAEIVEYDVYINRILQSLDRDRFKAEKAFQLQSHRFLNEQLTQTPVLEDGYVRSGGCWHKLVLASAPSDIAPGWFNDHSTYPCDMHVSQILVAADAQNAASNECSLGGEDRMQPTLSDSDLEIEAKRSEVPVTHAPKLNQPSNDPEWSHDLTMFKHCFIIQLYGDLDDIKQTHQQLVKKFRKLDAHIEDYSELQFALLHCIQPGQGFSCSFARTDYLAHASAMAPIQVYRQGDPNPDQIRMGLSGQLVGFNSQTDPASIQVTCVENRADLRLDQMARIAETAPFLDWLCLEVKTHYKWLVEMLGGKYVYLEPERTVINPFPDYQLFDASLATPLPEILARNTVQRIAFLLVEKKNGVPIRELNAEEVHIATLAIQSLYRSPLKNKRAPLLEDLYQDLKAPYFLQKREQVKKSKHLGSHLADFLTTPAGQWFNQQTNIRLSRGITGINLKDIKAQQPEWLKYYWCFLTLHHLQWSHCSGAKSRILHDTAGNLLDIAKAGYGHEVAAWKYSDHIQRCSLDLDNENLGNLSTLAHRLKEAINDSGRLHKNLWWNHAPARSKKLRSTIAAKIKKQNNSKSTNTPMDFIDRCALRGHKEDYYNVALSFPKILVDIASDSEADRILKQEIGLVVKDPFDRLAMLDEMRDAQFVPHASTEIEIGHDRNSQQENSV